MLTHVRTKHANKFHLDTFHVRKQAPDHCRIIANVLMTLEWQFDIDAMLRFKAQ